MVEISYPATDTDSVEVQLQINRSPVLTVLMFWIRRILVMPLQKNCDGAHHFLCLVCRRARSRQQAAFSNGYFFFSGSGWKLVLTNCRTNLNEKLCKWPFFSEIVLFYMVGCILCIVWAIYKSQFLYGEKLFLL